MGQYAVEETEKSWPVAICLTAFIGIGVYAWAPEIMARTRCPGTQLAQRENPLAQAAGADFTDVLQARMSIWRRLPGYAITASSRSDYKPPLISSAKPGLKRW